MVAYRFGPFRLLPDQRRLERDGTLVPLTPKAFDVVVALVQHRSRALSKDELLALAWPGSVVEEGNLAQQVWLLRRVLADVEGCVATLPRHGYRFVAPVVEEEEEPAAGWSSPHCLIWANRQYALSDGITIIGRGDDADVRIPLPSVSRRHARVVVNGQAARFEDLDSRHGSWRGTTRVHAPVALVSGDEIRLGLAVLLYRLASPADSTSD